MDKNKRWQQKQVESGRCPHCGKPCAPFYECWERRESKKLNRLLKRWVACGFLGKRKDGHWSIYWVIDQSKSEDIVTYKKSEDDCRDLPRIGKQYFDFDEIFVTVLEKEGRPMTEKEILDQSLKVMTAIKKSRREPVQVTVYMDDGIVITFTEKEKKS